MTSSEAGFEVHPGRALAVFSQATDARAVSAALGEALELDLTTVRDARVATALLEAPGTRRWRLVVAEHDLRGGSGIELLSRARSVDSDVVTVLVSRFPKEALDLDAMFFVDHHIRAGVSTDRLREEVLRAMGFSPGAARRPVSNAKRYEQPAPLPQSHLDRYPFGRAEERFVARTPIPSALGPVRWGGEATTRVGVPRSHSAVG